MASQSLYRKWRSQTFSDLIGQEATTRTLLNAVREGRLAHAYLFCGPRGTGKTSAARLLAKAINCANPQNGEPCNECLSCREITAGRSPDVIEIDAASNTGVDNIRDLRQNVNLLGTGGRYRVFVVDEVHMLSTAAFNALLKTLEEPPPHVIFVLATTEAHKVLPTIVSRCQRFDFRRIRTRDIVARLRHVADGEGLELEQAAAELLARAAQGGMRDGLSLLDQAIAYCGSHVDLERTRMMLGLADPGALRGLIVAVAEERPADALHQLHELVSTGADLRQLQQQLGEEWRALLLARAGADIAEVMDRTPDEARELAALAGRFSLEELMGCARVFARSETPARGLPVPQLALELALLECLTIRRTGGLAITAQPAPSDARANGRGTPTAHHGGEHHGGEHHGGESNAAITPAPIAHYDQRETPPPARREVHVATPDHAESEDQPNERPAGATDSAPQDVHALTRDEAALTPVDEPEESEESFEQDTTRVSSGAPSPTARGTDWLALAQRDWAVIKKVCKQQSPSTAALLTHASPVRCESGDSPVLVVEAQYEFHFEKLKAQKARDVVEWALEQVLGTPVRARFTLGGKDGAGKGGGATRATGPRSGAGARSTNGANDATSRTPPRADGWHGAAGPSDMTGTARNGHNGHEGQNGHDGRDRASSPVHEGNAASATPTAGNGRKPNARQSDPARLEREAQADAIVQEIERELGAQLREVRPLDDEEEPE